MSKLTEIEMDKLTVDPNNVPRNDQTQETIKKFLGSTDQEKLTIYKDLLAKLEAIKSQLKEAQLVLPVYSYSLHYALQNTTDRIREVEGLITLTGRRLVESTKYTEAIEAIEKDLFK